MLPCRLLSDWLYDEFQEMKIPMDKIEAVEISNVRENTGRRLGSPATPFLSALCRRKAAYIF